MAEQEGVGRMIARALVYEGPCNHLLSYGDLRELSSQRYLYNLEVAAEEGLEMFGASVLLLGSTRIFLALGAQVQELSDFSGTRV